MHTRPYWKGIPALAFVWIAAPLLAAADGAMPIFPQPKSITLGGSGFAVDDQTAILLPARPSEQDLLLSGMLRDELSDRRKARDSDGVRR
jgi:hypothetical protein